MAQNSSADTRIESPLTIADVCRVLRLSRRTFYRRRAELPLVELKGLPGRYSATRLRRYLDTGR